MRRRSARTGVQFSLFPFLAVLLCTMGSLIVLLLVLVQQARVQAQEQSEADAQEQPHAADAARQARQIEQQQKEIAAAAARLTDVRTELQQRLQSSRLDLSHLEDHIRRLREQLARMESDYQILKQDHQQDEGAVRRQRAELIQLNEKIAQAKAELEQARQLAASKPRSYAIVPYDGPRGTRRRPIYLECRADQLIIQPEGNVLLPADLQVPGAGNPLAAALRATREYLADAGGLQAGEPYPLLLVRPDGAETYMAARAAMSSWSSEYGYELIDADMPLEFPPADEALGDVVRRSIQLARQRQLALAETRARGYGAGGGYGGSGGRLGGFGGSAARPGGAYLSPSRDGGFEVRGAVGNDWLDSHMPKPGREIASPHDPPGAGINGSQSGNPTDHAQGGFYATKRNASGDNGGASAAANASAGAGVERPNALARHQYGSPGGNGHAAPQATEAAASGGAAAGAFAPAGEAQMTAPQIGSSSPASQANSAPEAATGRDVPPIAEARGKNWALPSTAHGATPFSRPIRVQVRADKLVVLPDRGDNGRPRVTPLNGPLESSIDEFVAQLWEHMNSWGIAGPRAYWKPILSVEVAPGGEARYAELAALMQQSGVEVQRKRSTQVGN